MCTHVHFALEQVWLHDMLDCELWGPMREIEGEMRRDWLEQAVVWWEGEMRARTAAFVWVIALNVRRGWWWCRDPLGLVLEWVVKCCRRNQSPSSSKSQKS